MGFKTFDEHLAYRHMLDMEGLTRAREKENSPLEKEVIALRKEVAQLKAIVQEILEENREC